MNLARWSLAWLGTLLVLLACSSTDSERVVRSSQALTEVQSRILGFENAPADWSASNGSPITSSSNASQGSAALSIVPNGYTQITSVNLPAPGNARATATLDVQVPTQLPWGEVRLVARVPSLQHYWVDLGGEALQNLAPGAFRTVSFPIPQHIQDALNGSAPDVSFVVVLNAPTGVGPFLIDNLVVSTSTSGSSGSSSEEVALSLFVPRGASLADVMLSGTQKLTIDDRSTLGEEGSLTVVASIGPDLSEFGAEVTVYAHILSEGDVDFLRSQSTVHGHITTEGVVRRQDNVSTLGGVSEGVPVSSVETRWTVNWPLTLEAPVTLPPDAPNQELAPGGYSSLSAYSRSTLTLRSGTYFFDSFVLEPQVNFRVDASGGPVLLYVRDTLRLNVGIEYLGGKEGHVLFGYFGTEAPLFREGLAASVVAPNATIELRRPDSGNSFRGSFFGRGVHVFSDARVEHIPLDWAFICPLGDFDGDGVLDCFDECRFNPEKSQRGICGCSEPETDSDGDGVPDCMDECPFDAGDFHAGTCGCPSDPAPAGTPCFDDICFGSRQTCDGQGQCGDLSCRPHPSCRALYSKANDKFYWVCDHPVSWDEAVALCANQKGSKLASIAEERINRLIVSAATTDGWIGANALEQSGEWYWLDYNTLSGRKFWTAGASGGPVYSRFNAFRGAPAASAECVYASTSGAWTAADCAETHGFVCEISNDRLVGWPYDPPRGSGDIVGIPPHQRAGDDCVDPATWQGDADSEAEVLGLFAACQECLELNGADQCDAVCVGPAAIPDENSRCLASDDDFLWSNPACGDQPLQVALDENGDEIPCSSSQDCVGEPPASGPKTCVGNNDCTDANETCVNGYCTKLLMCDTQAGRCVIPNSSCGAGQGGVPERCDEVELCEPEPTQTTTTLEADGASLQPLPSDPATFFGDEPALPDEIPPYDGESCEGCGALSASVHPWCRVDMEPNSALPAKSNESTRNAKNDGDKIEFQFEPVLEFKQDAQLGALGIPRIDLRAAAGLSAAVKVNFAGNPRFEIIDALGELDASHCGFRGDVKLEIFGYDVIESYKQNVGLPYELPANTCEDDEDCLSPQQECQKVYDQFAQAVDRVEKAMRDAAELMRQYREAVREGRKLPDDLCRTVIPDSMRPRGFPEGFCPAEGPTETPEQTIQRFIDYYRQMVVGFGEKKITEGALSLNDYAQRLIAYLPNPQGEIELANFSPQPEEAVIIAAQFFIGPIPAFLEVGSTVDYGVLVRARAGLRVGDLVSQVLDFYSVDANSTEVAYAGVSGVPYAGAGLYMFAGVGFGIPGFKVQVGVQGDIHIGTVSLPAYAGAGLWIGSRADERDPPPSLANFATGAYLIPRKIYSAQLGYTAGLEARVRNVLSGSIAGKIKLQVLFFSKTWKATILRFDGICSYNDENPDGSLPPCDFPIFSVTGEAVAAEGTFGWGFVKMPTSFPDLRLPSRSQILAELTKELGEPPDLPSPEDLPVQEFSTSRVNQLLYDRFCDTCLQRGELPQYPEDDCFSGADCCEENDICYRHIQGERAGRSECRACGVRGAECYLDSHCCPVSGLAHGICALGKCASGVCSECENDDDCTPGRGCGSAYEGEPRICLVRKENGELDEGSCAEIIR